MAGQPDAGVAHGLQRLAQACGGPLRRGGRVVQLMRQTRGQLAQRHQLIALRLNPGRLADAVGHEGHQTLAEQGHALQHLRENSLLCRTRNARGKHGAAGAAVMRQPRVREQAGNLPGITAENNRIGAASPLDANLPLQNHGEIVQRFTLPGHDLSRLETPLLEIFRQPGEVVLGEIREDLDLAQIVDQALPVTLAIFSAKSHLAEVLMSELHGNRAFAHARCHSFHGTMTDVTGGKDSGHAAFRPVRVALQWPSRGPLSVAHQVGSGQDKSALIPLHHAGEPVRVWLCANEDRKQICGHRRRFCRCRRHEWKRLPDACLRELPPPGNGSAPGCSVSF